jgi:hypothetical protein
VSAEKQEEKEEDAPTISVDGHQPSGRLQAAAHRCNDFGNDGSESDDDNGGVDKHSREPASCSGMGLSATLSTSTSTATVNTAAGKPGRRQRNFDILPLSIPGLDPVAAVAAMVAGDDAEEEDTAVLRRRIADLEAQAEQELLDSIQATETFDQLETDLRREKDARASCHTALVQQIGLLREANEARARLEELVETLRREYKQELDALSEIRMREREQLSTELRRTEKLRESETTGLAADCGWPKAILAESSLRLSFKRMSHIVSAYLHFFCFM